jgi:hypothetical protein
MANFPRRILSYGRRRNGRFRILAAIACSVVLIVGGFVVLCVRSGLSNRANDLWLEHRCASYSQPPDLIVYEEDSERTGKLIRSGRYQLLRMPPDSAKFPTPVVFGPFEPIRRFWGYSLETATATFLHQLHSPDGEAWLVIVNSSIYSSTNEQRTVSLCAFARTLLPIFHGGVREGKGNGTYWIELAGNDRFRMFAGQPSSEPSKFVIRYELNGESGNIEGEVADDGTVSLRVTNGKLKCNAIPFDFGGEAISGQKVSAKEAESGTGAGQVRF